MKRPSIVTAKAKEDYMKTEKHPLHTDTKLATRKLHDTQKTVMPKVEPILPSAIYESCLDALAPIQPISAIAEADDENSIDSDEYHDTVNQLPNEFDEYRVAQIQRMNTQLAKIEGMLEVATKSSNQGGLNPFSQMRTTHE